MTAASLQQRIEVISNLHRGSIFRVFLPSATARPKDF
jgi:hypothetical protein